MNLTILKTFISIEETGSLVRASEQLNVTQSTVTARLKQLEEELGQTLVMRHKSGVVLTAAGHKLLKYARVMTGLWLQARQETSLPDDVDSLCNMGCHMDLWPDFGRLVFDEIFRERKSTALSIWPGDAAELDRWFGEGLVDAALTAHPVAHDNQTSWCCIPPSRTGQLRLTRAMYLSTTVMTFVESTPPPTRWLTRRV